MSLPRFFYRPITEGQVEITGPEVHHIAGVKRLKVGDWVEVFDGAGRMAKASIQEISSRKARLNIEELVIHEAQDKPKIIIASSIAKGERFDWLISKCTELGVDRICPVIFEWTVKQAKGETILKRYENLTIAAAKQSQRIFLPRIDNPCPFTESLSALQKELPGAEILFGSPSSKASPLIGQNFAAQKDTIAFIGPEGGMTEQEEQLLREAGGREVRLTDTILRIETAAVCFASILAAERLTKTD